MTPLPSNGPGFDGTPHLQRFAQSSAMPDHVALQVQHQQVRQFYIQQVAAQNEGMQGQVNNGADIMPRHPKDDQRLNMRSLATENIGPSLMRYHSAPGSMLGSLVGMGDDLPSQDADLGQYLSRDVMALESRGLLHLGDEAHPLNNGAQGNTAGVILDRDLEHNGKLISPHSRFKPLAAVNGNSLHAEFLSQMSAGAKGDCLENASPALSASLLQATSTDMLAETGMLPPNVMPNFSVRNALMPTNMTSKSNGLAHVLSATTHGLLRHSSSPAGFLSQLNDDLSSGNSSDDSAYGQQGAAVQPCGRYIWDEAGKVKGDSSSLVYAARKRMRDGEDNFYLSSAMMDTQKGDALAENVYFPDKSSPDFVTCRTRAKRGCATHPRSIAERVRRNKINDRLKKLQDLVPNMDKQTNTVEMLDEAVEYVKQLQSQVQELKESRSKCRCSCSKEEESQ
eukprot:c7767_g1_i1 orf=100-1455(-)